MTSTPLPRPTRRRPWAARSLAAALAAGSLAGALASPATAGAEERPRVRESHRVLRLCDASGCYHAWRAVDTDGDGVADADELMAGTDPTDPRSRPGLDVVADLAGRRQLPSFEAGLGAFAVLPVDLQEMALKFQGADPLTAFPFGEGRKEGLARLGIDEGDLEEHGIDIGRDGLTLGLAPPTKGDELPEARIGGIPRSQISADGGFSGTGDGSTVPLVTGHGAITEHIDYGDWSSTRYEDGTQVIVTDEGVTVFPPGSPDYYTDPDATPVTEPTAEQLEAWERFNGAVKHTVEGRGTPKPDEDDLDPEDRNAPIILVDTDLALNAVVLDAPRITTAQPEFRPDLPNPMNGVKGAPGQGGCDGRC